MELEISESLVIQNPERTIRLMQEMKKTGIRFALDDLGTGYSFLGPLRHYRCNIIQGFYFHKPENAEPFSSWLRVEQQHLKSLAASSS